MFIHGEGGQQDNSLVVVPEAQDVRLLLLDGFVSGIGDFRQRASLKIPEAGDHRLHGGQVVFIGINFGVDPPDAHIAPGFSAPEKTQNEYEKQRPSGQSSHEIPPFSQLYHGEHGEIWTNR